MAEGLAKRKHIRAGHRGVVTKRLEEARLLLEGDGTPDTRAMVRYMFILQEKLDLLKRLDSEILELLEVEVEIATEIEQADAYNQELLEILLRLKDISSGTTPTTATPVSTGGGVTGAAHHNTRLPKLTLRTFDGDITQWLSFWDSYQAAVHSNTDLSDVQKFTYLKSLVERSAKESISGLTLSADNYKEAIDILEKRFGNKQKIIDRHMDILLNIEPVSSPNNVEALRKLYDRVESNIRALKALGVTASSYGALLSSVLIKKLPRELRLLVSRKVTGDWDLSTIMEALGVELEARERTVNSREGGTQLHSKGIERASVIGLVAGQRAEEKPGCCYCHQAHSPSDCTIVTSQEERKRILKSAGRCFACLRKGHIGRECRSRGRCRVCNGKHHVSLCQVDKTGSPAQSKPDSQPMQLSVQSNSHNQLDPRAPSFKAKSDSTTSCLAENGKTVLLQTARATLYNPTSPKNQLEVSIIFDTGSQRSYISKSASDYLRLKPQERNILSIMTFGSSSGLKQSCELVHVGIRKGERSIKEISLLSVPVICEPLTGPSIQSCIESCPHLRKLELADVSTGSCQIEIAVLIGLDYYWDFVTGETIHSKDGPVALHTSLGWVLSGPVPWVDGLPTSTNLITHTLRVNSCSSRENSQRLEHQLKAFWDLESLGIVDTEHTIYDQFQSIVDFQNGHYEVMLPWKDPLSSLPDNYDLSLKRLHSLLRRLKQDPELLQQYDQVIREQIAQGIVQVVENPELAEGDRIHYLPHHAVIKHDRATTKIRVVYDASAKSSGPSLNQCLHVGPKFNQRILDILLRFRTYDTALVADIEKAFLMVSMNKKDRDVLRFLWVKDIVKEPPEIQVLKFTRMVFGVASSPFLLNATIHHHLESHRGSQPIPVERLLDSIYVDDVISGAEHPEAAYQLYVDSKEILQKGGFNLRKFKTNDANLQNAIEESEEGTSSLKELSDSETYVKATLGKSQKTLPGEQKVLGLRWKIDTDEFVFDLNDVVQAAEQLLPTKRHVVSIIGRVYDPFGILSPVVISFKKYFQELCTAKLQWDEPLPEHLQKKWETLINGLRHVVVIALPRCLKTGVETDSSTTYQLCGFGDASLSAYAAVVYLLIQNGDFSQCRIVCSKTRVSPINSLTIPRLELLSALLLARLIDSVTHSLTQILNLSQPLCFLDSKVAYYWICGAEKNWRPFIQNRVNEIRRLMPAKRWRHCAGTQNPADAPSRGQTLSELVNNRMWFNGPEWLLNMVENKQPTMESSMPPECEMELKKTQNPNPVLLNTEKVIGLNNLIDIQGYSEVDRLFRVTAYVLLFVRRLRKTDQSPSIVTAELFNRAEVLWIQIAQSTLREEPHYESWKNQLGFFTDNEGLLRCKGRLKNAGLPYTTQFPLILPQNHPLTILLVRQAHEKVFHNGVKETLTQLRSKYWIIKGRSTVKSFIKRCVLCRRMEGPHYTVPPSPPLPAYRVQEAPPFAYLGVDFAGPLFIKMEKKSTCTSKAWICLYTCCTTRAIHLDLVLDLTTESFLRCFKRFVARRGIPCRVVSDNGKTFKGAARIIRRILTHKDVQQHLAGLRVEWTFNVERAPWWGGMFERLVRSTKRCLRKIVGKAKLSYEELLTTLTEIEMVINCRPLSYVSSNDLEEPLTPSHLLIGRRLMNLPEDLVYSKQRDDDYSVTPEVLTRRMKFLNSTLDRFWRRWREEYLLELRSSHSLSQRGSKERKISKGDIVVIYDENERRGFWRLGLIEELILGTDGHVRGAKVKVSTGGKPTLWQRPVQRLYPLEVNCFKEAKDCDSEKSVDDTESIEESPCLDSRINPSHSPETNGQSSDNNPRPKRTTAIEARDRIAAQMMSD